MKDFFNGNILIFMVKSANFHLTFSNFPGQDGQGWETLDVLIPAIDSLLKKINIYPPFLKFSNLLSKISAV